MEDKYLRLDGALIGSSLEAMISCYNKFKGRNVVKEKLKTIEVRSRKCNSNFIYDIYDFDENGTIYLKDRNSSKKISMHVHMVNDIMGEYEALRKVEFINDLDEIPYVEQRKIYKNNEIDSLIGNLVFNNTYGFGKIISSDYDRFLVEYEYGGCNDKMGKREYIDFPNNSYREKIYNIKADKVLNV